MFGKKALGLALLAISALAFDKCDCNGIANERKEKCYSKWDLDEAIDEARSGDTIYIFKKIYTDGEINIKQKSLTIEGGVCGTNRGEIFVGKDTKSRAVFKLGDKRNQHVTFKKIEFDGNGKRRQLIRTDEYKKKDTERYDDKWSYYDPVSLAMYSCSIKNFKTGSYVRGGAAIQLEVAKKFILKNVVVQNNKLNLDEERYGGGGAIWVQEVPKGSEIDFQNVKCIGNRNTKMFHGLGGCMKVGRISGNINISGSKFEDNAASDGGALHFARLERDGNINIWDDNEFLYNEARDGGSGSRGGALRFKIIFGNVYIGGRYIGNRAERGIIANNRLFGKTSLGGYFKDNYSKTGAVIWDTNMRGLPGKLTIRKDVELIDNYSDDFNNGQVRVFYSNGNPTKKMLFSDGNKHRLGETDVVVEKIT